MSDVKLLPCSVEDCSNQATESLMCKKHATRVRRNGTPHLKTFKERILSRIIIDKTTGCWLWQKYKNEWGYGRVRRKSIKELAHRAVWKEYNGEIPTGLLVCHKCDTPACVNPDHLFLGTHTDNVRDCIQKGRFSNGK